MVTGLKDPMAGGKEQPGVGVVRALPDPKAGKVVEAKPQTGVEVGVGVEVAGKVGKGATGNLWVQANGRTAKRNIEKANIVFPIGNFSMNFEPPVKLISPGFPPICLKASGLPSGNK